MADTENLAGNLAHTPEVDGAPPNTHGTPTRPSTVAAELAAGLSPHQHPTLIPPKIDPVRVGIMSNPVVSSEPSGATVRSFSPRGVHDVNSRGEAK